MIVELIILYIFFGIFVFKLCKLGEDNAKYYEPEWYESFYKKSRFYRISVRLCQIIFWPFIIISIILYILYMCIISFYKFVIYFYKDLIE